MYNLQFLSFWDSLRGRNKYVNVTGWHPPWPPFSPGCLVFLAGGSGRLCEAGTTPATRRYVRAAGDFFVLSSAQKSLCLPVYFRKLYADGVWADGSSAFTTALVLVFVLLWIWLPRNRLAS